MTDRVAYSTLQKLAFVGLLLGTVACCSTAFMPWWEKGELSINNVAYFFDIDIPFIGDLKVVKAYGGLFFICYQMVTGIEEVDSKDCEMRAWDKIQVQGIVVRIGVVVAGLIMLICSLAALCRLCCCGGKTICHGIFSFLGGAAGLVVVGLFAIAGDDGNFELSLLKHEYDWCFFVYAVGAGLVALSSIMLCVGSPKDNTAGVIVPTVGQYQPLSMMVQQDNMAQQVNQGFPYPYPAQGPIHGYPQGQPYQYDQYQDPIHGVPQGNAGQVHI